VGGRGSLDAESAPSSALARPDDAAQGPHGRSQRAVVRGHVAHARPRDAGPAPAPRRAPHGPARAAAAHPAAHRAHRARPGGGRLRGLPRPAL
ncbi:MAG: hypothetical protein AVDCRST_MAG85-133, partial [uncultured Solirubrobacteraceae bacterium]